MTVDIKKLWDSYTPGALDAMAKQAAVQRAERKRKLATEAAAVEARARKKAKLAGKETAEAKKGFAKALSEIRKHDAKMLEALTGDKALAKIKAQLRAEMEARHRRFLATDSDEDLEDDEDEDEDLDDAEDEDSDESDDSDDSDDDDQDDDDQDDMSAAKKSKDKSDRATLKHLGFASSVKGAKKALAKAKKGKLR